MQAIRMTDLALAGKRVLIREDLNVPIDDGRVTSDARLRAALPTVRRAAGEGARVLVMSHLGRPKEGERDPALTLRPVAKAFSELLGKPVRLHEGELEAAAAEPGEVVLLENVRFLKGEKKDDPRLAARMAALCDIFVMDAFGTAHRAEASTHGVALAAPVACAGPLLAAELDALERALEQPEAAAGRGGRGFEGLHEARGAREPDREGGRARGRRRHRQHFPRRGGPAGRQVAARAGHDRRREAPARAGRGEGRRSADTDGRRGRARVRGDGRVRKRRLRPRSAPTR